MMHSKQNIIEYSNRISEILNTDFIINYQYYLPFTVSIQVYADEITIMLSHKNHHSAFTINLELIDFMDSKQLDIKVYIQKEIEHSLINLKKEVIKKCLIIQDYTK